MSGHDVRVLQDFLTRAGFSTHVDGTIGPITETNVRRFERKYRLTADGIVDAPFVRELRAVVALGSSKTAVNGGLSGGAAFALEPTPKPTTSSSVGSTGSSKQLGGRVLRSRMRGDDVSQLQGYLTLAGFPTAVDGQFGPVTKANVIAFQEAHSLPATGIVTAAVVQALRLAIAAFENSAPAGQARINPDGTASAPGGAPALVTAMIAAANTIIDKPYAVGGGHARWNDVAYDCSGAVSYALYGAGLLSAPEDSTELESYGGSGPGRWITIYADPSHTWVVVAGIAFDTADFGGPNIPAGTGPRWRSNPVGNLADGGRYVLRHPPGL